MKKTDPEVGRQFSEMLRVLLNALIRIGADLTGMRQTKCAEGRQPLGQEILDETLAQDEL